MRKHSQLHHQLESSLHLPPIRRITAAQYAIPKAILHSSTTGSTSTSNSPAHIIEIFGAGQIGSHAYISAHVQKPVDVGAEDEVFSCLFGCDCCNHKDG